MREKILNALFHHRVNEAEDRIFRTRLTILSWAYLSTALCFIQCVALVWIFGEIQDDAIGFIPFMFLHLLLLFLLIPQGVAFMSSIRRRNYKAFERLKFIIDGD